MNSVQNKKDMGGMSNFKIFLQDLAKKPKKYGKLFDKNVLKLIKNYISYVILQDNTFDAGFTDEKNIFLRSENTMFVLTKNFKIIKKNRKKDTIENSVRCLLENNTKFTNVESFKIKEPTDWITSFCIVNDKIFVGTYDGLFVYGSDCKFIEKMPKVYYEIPEEYYDPLIDDLTYSAHSNKIFALAEEKTVIIVYNLSENTSERIETKYDFTNIFAYKNNIVCTTMDDRRDYVCIFSVTGKLLKKMVLYSPHSGKFFLDEYTGTLFSLPVPESLPYFGLYIFEGWLNS